MAQQIFDNGMTAHVWAQQRQESGRSHNGNFFFSGPAIYSYGSHYVAGYVAPGPLYLVNGDSSSITTNGKHLPAVRRAIDYGRRAFANHATVPSLNDVAHIFDGLRCNRFSKEAARGRLAEHMESGVETWPGVEAAALIYQAAGMTPAKAQSKAEAGDKRVQRAEAARKEAAAKRELDQEAGCAKVTMQFDTPESVAANIRATLSKAAGESGRQSERLERKAAEESREYHRQAKAAKAKGWTRIAAHCRACQKAARAEIREYQAGIARYQFRASISAAIKGIRNGSDSLNLVTTRLCINPESVIQRAAERLESYADSLLEVATSPFAMVTVPAARRDAMAEAAEAARAMAGQYRAKGAALRLERQAEDRTAWLAGEITRTGWWADRLADSEGGALIRAEGVERDESGAIVGGTLRTSWGATVPLAHAIRAFRFLKLCRAKGQAWAANGRTIRVGHFRIDTVDSSGNFVAGCHRINWQEVARLAAVLGVAELSESDSALELSRGAK